MFKNIKKKLLIAASIFLVSLAGYAWYETWQGNFHAITRNEAYRSAQLDKNELKHYIRRYNIKSIINLRAKRVNEHWYKTEIEASKTYNVTHYDIPLSAEHEPDVQEINQLIHIFRIAQRPVLMHCKAGADRSGLAAAIWKVIVDKEPKSEADDELSIIYGHIPIGPTYAMDKFFDKWQPAQASHLSQTVVR
ncbi:MAG: dual specificity protein phosphatase family protein [Deltaproteobacteria bacterium]|nr:dual specificity protein phosphatase family protein [Deltaproteobacteria bacterium]MCL5791785.1 dual specificity protein phosphatase family protein [Deltaproteobacteria bacterium]